MHYAVRRMTSGAQKQVSEFMSRKVPENYSVPHSAAAGELIGVVRKYVRHSSEAAVFGDHREAEAVLSLAQAIRHGSG
jgi:hypothetical protein